MTSETPGRPVPERRAEPRLARNDTPAELMILSGVGPPHTSIPAIIVDISKSGLLLVANTQLGPGQHVRIKMGKLLIFAEVRHCHGKGAMFASGAKIADVMGVHGVGKQLTDKQIESIAQGGGVPRSRSAA